MPANFSLARAYVELSARGPLKEQLASAAKQAREMTQGIQAQVDKIGSVAARTFAVATGAITGFVAAASPDAINTLTGSIALLAGEIGKNFLLPYVVKAAAAIQAARNYICGMSEETKSTLVSWTMWGVAIAGTTGALVTLIGWVNKTAVAIGLLYAHPVITGLAILAAAVGVVAWNLRSANREAEAMMARMEKRRAMSYAAVAESPEFQSLQQVPEAKRAEDLEARIQNAVEEVKRTASAVANAPLMDRSKVLPSLLGFGPTTTPSATEANEKARDHLATLRKIQEASRKGIDLNKEGTSTGGSGLLTAMAGMQHQIVSIADYGRMALQAGANDNPLDAERRRMELDNNIQFHKIAASNELIRDLQMGLR